MKIGVIGAGFIGRAVAQLALAAGHEVMLSNSRGPHTMSSVVSGILGVQVGSADDAARFGDVVLVAIPFQHYRSVPAQWLEGKTVMDANNYYPDRDGHIPELDRFETTTSRLLADHLTHSHVVKVFNAIFAPDLTQDARPHGAPDRRALPVAADDATAKAVVTQLLDELGFDAVDAGELDESWRFERAKPAYCVRLDQAGLKAALAAAERAVELPPVERHPPLS
ncbi:NADP oxidoreductase [Pseudomonas sp. PA-7-1E]|uniref:NADP oxidoreductase n=5 Tax=Pseudomonas TaxID=286 RepID=A0A4Q0HWX8_PSEAZ|nr:NADPH-dependent F420 reductase [Pseudomonas sp. J380]KRP95524.1 NADP oxidoreductase [Pseudomonas lactis]KWV78400.1 NADP oxidoreductase coenzyme F420-dependent [Pseudomonas fluorescens]MBA1254184.1 NADPH-dependent F420 reductase [Pseudomonas carnis]MBJ2223511.1 NADPH-dependent F420 reductase [Pseudomonas sp. MF7451]MBJ2281880.1 NADPH-dependent F420 reductase [Pseudomonas sp. MF6767]MBJ2305438.1 NADPH-dependent F420 reductase [Pseudomonas sp. MF2846]MBK3491600.1 NADPH-dependent F420 reducta